MSAHDLDFNVPPISGFCERRVIHFEGRSVTVVMPGIRIVRETLVSCVSLKTVFMRFVPMGLKRNVFGIASEVRMIISILEHGCDPRSSSEIKPGDVTLGVLGKLPNAHTGLMHTAFGLQNSSPLC